MSVKAVKLIQPGEIQGMPDDDTPLLVVPAAAELFRARAARMHTLVAQQSDSPWLVFCAQLMQAQVDCLSSVQPQALEQNVVRESMLHKLPPLSITTWLPEAQWPVVFEALCRSLEAQPLAPGVRGALERVKCSALSDQIRQAKALLAAEESQLPPDAVPFIGATLQLLWVTQAKALSEYVDLHKGESGLCPVCGSHPVASVVRIGERDLHRYMVCSLCASEWYAPRARCTNCETPKEVSMLGDHRDSALQGECCEECRGYLKLMFQSKEPQLDAVADDLASINLDLALAAEGFSRTGRNLFFTVGQVDPIP
jgi:FdhE protein